MKSCRCGHQRQSASPCFCAAHYVVQVGSTICPIEVKSGVKGSMQSMRVFLREKNLSVGIRTSLENFSRYDDILVYPLYAIKNIFCQTIS